MIARIGPHTGPAGLAPLRPFFIRPPRPTTPLALAGVRLAWPAASPAGVNRIEPLARPDRTPKPSSIYAVDDKPDLTQLYVLLLTGAGHRVRAFTQRTEALAALEEEPNKPDLLITNYLGRSMPVGQFLQACRAIHPKLRILMASGFHRIDLPCSMVQPDRFLRKPFTAAEFLQEVNGVLAA